jgi:hypothetical protein
MALGDVTATSINEANSSGVKSLGAWRVIIELRGQGVWIVRCRARGGGLIREPERRRPGLNVNVAASAIGLGDRTLQS